MFDHQACPPIKVDKVFTELKNFYKTNRGNSQYLNQDYLSVLIEQENLYFEKHINYHTIPSQELLGDVSNKIGVSFYTKLVNDKVGDIYNLIFRNNFAICSVCGGTADTLDHVLPKRIFTQYTITPVNLVPLCSRCNRKKGEKCSLGNNQVIFHPYFHDYHELRGLKMEHRISETGDFLPSFSFEDGADTNCVYNFEQVFELSQVLDSLAVRKIISITQSLQKKNINEVSLKNFAYNLIKQRVELLTPEIDDKWEVLLFNYLFDHFDIYFNTIKKKSM